MQYYKILPHTADLRLKVYGATKEELFRHALQSMFEVMQPKNGGVSSSLQVLRVQSSDLNSLLVDFLSEALTFSDIHDEAYLDATIHKFKNTALEAELQGIKIKGYAGEEIKAVTHHGVEIKKFGDHWETEIIFDL